MDYAVIGLGFGDEGKGRVVDYLCKKFPEALVVRYSGGQQAGHTVQLDGVRHVFSNFGSGTFRGVPTFWSKYCTVDPIGILTEYEILKEKGIKPSRLFIDPKCPVTTPYDKWRNINASAIAHGTCGVGVGTTFQREEDHYHLQVRDLEHPEILKLKLEAIRTYYKLVEKPEETAKFLKECDILLSIITIDSKKNVFSWYDIRIFEGSQGLMLDQEYGIFPHVTRSSVGLKNVLKMTKHVHTYLVTRCYETRHGNGPMTGEKLPENALKTDIVETNVLNEFQGEFRKGVLNLDTLEYAFSKIDDDDLNYSLVITCADHMTSKFYVQRKGNIQEYDNIRRFSQILGAHLGISRILVSNSPEGDLISIKSNLF